jgi:hypothetical protein
MARRFIDATFEQTQVTVPREYAMGGKRGRERGGLGPGAGQGCLMVGTEAVVGFVILTDQGVAAWEVVKTDFSDF